MDVELDGEKIHLSWDFNSSVPIYGFSGVILDPENSALYQSPVVQSTERKLTMNYALKDSKNSVCLRALANQSVVLVQVCKNVEVSDLKIIVGILAGTIFIIPCIVAMMFIIYKDYKVRQLENFQQLLEEEQDDGPLSKVTIELSHDNIGVSYANKMSHDDHLAATTDNITDEYEMAEKMKQELQGIDNVSFSATPSDCEKSKDHSNGKGVTSNTTNKSHQNTDDKNKSTDEISKEIRKNDAITLKVDVNLARQMALTDSEFTEFNIKL